jgi:diaminopimelate decarboxylase
MDNAGESKAVNGAVVALNRPNGEYVSGFLGGRGQPRHPSWAPDVGPEPVAICLEECAVALLERVLSERPETPEVVFLPTRAAERYRCMADLKQAVSADTGLDVEFAYSLKTNYFNGLIDMAREQDFLVEAISQLEAQKAIAAGFEAGQIILNGPAKWWPRMLVSSPVRAVFCDSVEELETLSRRNPRFPVAALTGIRLRASSHGSRFGVEVDSQRAVDRVSVALGSRRGVDRFGVHFHMSPASIGAEQWFDLYEWVLNRARSLEKSSGAAVVCLDIGGGWSPHAFDVVLAPRLGQLAVAAMAMLPGLRTLVLEPGRGLAQPTMALITRVLEVRYLGTELEVVVDASIADVPEAKAYRHPVHVRGHALGSWSPLGAGDARVLGRSCMESDVIVSAVSVPDWVAPGDVMVIDHVGAYDQSKSYAFGRG